MSTFSIFSDLNIALVSGDVPAHKFVLSSRSDKWGVPDLTKVDDLGNKHVYVHRNKNLYMYIFVYLDWTTLPLDVGKALLKWIYTDQVDFSKGDSFTLSLMKTADSFLLDDLVNKYVQHIFKYDFKILCLNLI